jgi:NAD dependent epimerase/dehydratase family enzyme
MSWIHLQDFCRAVQFIIDQADIKGAVNVTAPNPIDNRTFMKTLRKACKMPFGLNQPVALLEIGSWLIGTETELLLKSRNVYPGKLLQHEFEFKYPKIDAALRSLI